MTVNPYYISLIVFVSLVIFAGLVKILIFNKNKVIIIKPLFLIALLVFPISTFLLFVQFVEFENREAHKSWPTTEGAIIESKIVGERAIRPQIIYQYKVDSVLYIDTSSLNAPMFGGKRKKHDVARALIADYPVGKKLIVSYDTVNPRNSEIVDSVTWDVLAKIGFYGFLILISAFCLMLPRKPKGSSV